MVVNINIDGITYEMATPGTPGRIWGPAVSEIVVAMSQAYLQHVGGSFFLTAEVDFGDDYGIKTAYISHGDNPTTSGAVRLSYQDVIAFRNAAGTGSNVITFNSSDQLLVNGNPVGGDFSVLDTSTIDLTLSSAVLSGNVNSGSLNNTHIASDAAIAKSKFAAGTASRVEITDASGFLTESSVTSTELGFLSGSSSNLQTQITAASSTASAAQTTADAALPKSGGTMTGNLFLNGVPSSDSQAATKAYVDSVATGLHALTACRVATTTNGTFSTAFDNGSTVDGVVLATGDRILIKDQTDQTTNGVYVVQAAGAPVRATDADTWSELIGALIFITAGTVNANTQWISQTAAGGTLGSSNITFAQSGASTSYTADGQGLELSGTQFSLELANPSLSKSGSGLSVGNLGPYAVTGITVSGGTTVTGTVNFLGGNAAAVGFSGQNLTVYAPENQTITASGANGTAGNFNFVGSGGANVSKSGSTITIHAPNPSAGGGSGSPGGSNTQVQFNDSGSFGGDSGLTYDKATDALTVGGDLTVNGESTINDDLTVNGDATVNGDGAINGDLDISGDLAVTGSIDGTYKEQTSTTLGSASSTLTVSSIPAQDWLEVECDLLLNNATGAEQISVTFNGSSSGYSYFIREGSSSSTGSGSSSIVSASVTQTGNTRYKLSFRIGNKSAVMKQWIGQGVAQTDATTAAPLNMWEMSGCWNSTAARISSLVLSIGNSAQFQTGSEVIVRGA